MPPYTPWTITPLSPYGKYKPEEYQAEIAATQASTQYQEMMARDREARAKQELEERKYDLLEDTTLRARMRQMPLEQLRRQQTAEVGTSEQALLNAIAVEQTRKKEEDRALLADQRKTIAEQRAADVYGETMSAFQREQKEAAKKDEPPEWVGQQYRENVRKMAIPLATYGLGASPLEVPHPEVMRKAIEAQGLLGRTRRGIGEEQKYRKEEANIQKLRPDPNELLRQRNERLKFVLENTRMGMQVEIMSNPAMAALAMDSMMKKFKTGVLNVENALAVAKETYNQTEKSLADGKTALGQMMESSAKLNAVAKALTPAVMNVLRTQFHDMHPDMDVQGEEARIDMAIDGLLKLGAESIVKHSGKIGADRTKPAEQLYQWLVAAHHAASLQLQEKDATTIFPDMIRTFRPNDPNSAERIARFLNGVHTKFNDRMEALIENRGLLYQAIHPSITGNTRR